MTHGTGDAFASALCGAVMAGRPLAESAHIAGEFVRHAMESTQFQPNHTERGVSFELNLDELTRLGSPLNIPTICGFGRSMAARLVEQCG